MLINNLNEESCDAFKRHTTDHEVKKKKLIFDYKFKKKTTVNVNVPDIEAVIG